MSLAPERRARRHSWVSSKKRYGTVDEIEALAAYFAGPGAGFVTNASLTIDGGFIA